jgi:hypothetical protein
MLKAPGSRTHPNVEKTCISGAEIAVKLIPIKMWAYVGLDPAIHPLRKTFAKSDGCAKPAHAENYVATEARRAALRPGHEVCESPFTNL